MKKPRKMLSEWDAPYIQSLLQLIEDTKQSDARELVHLLLRDQHSADF